MLDVTENLKGMEIAAEIRARIKATTGLNASAGISYNGLTTVERRSMRIFTQWRNFEILP